MYLLDVALLDLLLLWFESAWSQSTFADKVFSMWSFLFNVVYRFMSCPALCKIVLKNAEQKKPLHHPHPHHSQSCAALNVSYLSHCSSGGQLIPKILMFSSQSDVTTLHISRHGRITMFFSMHAGKKASHRKSWTLGEHWRFTSGMKGCGGGGD